MRARPRRSARRSRRARASTSTTPNSTAALDGVDFAEVCITSDLVLDAGEAAPADAFRLPDVAGVAVVVERAPGVKCARSWRYFDPATADPDYPDVTPRDAAALRELGVERRA